MPYLLRMTTLTITAKGQVTLRKELLRHLGVSPGDKVSVEELPNGRIEVKGVEKARTGKMSDAYGMFYRKDGPRLAIEEMNEVIAKGWAGLL